MTASRTPRLLALSATLALVACGGSHDHRVPPQGAVTYSVAGSITGLTAAGLVLQNNGADDLVVAANASSFALATRVAAGGTYDVTVATQPDGLTCSVAQGTGSDLQAVVTNVSVTCNPVTHTIGGAISGLTADGLVLQNNGGDDLAVDANVAAFEFVTPVAAGGDYSVTLLSQPTGLTCSVSNGAGGHVAADISGVQVTCSTSALSIGGTVAGLTGSGLILQNNGDDDLTVLANATSLEFATPVAYGGVYAVTVLAQPAGQTCSVTQGAAVATTPVTTVALTCVDIVTYTVTPGSGPNGSIAPGSAVVVNSGTDQAFLATPDSGYAIDQWLLDGVAVQSGGALYTLFNVSAGHALTVTFAQATLTPSVSSLALSVNCLPSSACVTTQNAALTGTPRIITVTNTGSIAATGVSIAYAAWPAGTFASSSCGSVLAAASSCTISITPGATATSDCTTGVAPTAGTLTFSAEDAADSQVDVVVLGYGCIYQGGYLFAIDDTTADTASIGGKVAALTDQAAAYSAGVMWSSDGSSGVDYAAILGSDDTSTASIPSPTSPAYPAGTPAYTACNAALDGACNTANIVAYYDFNRVAGGSAPTPLAQYAAGVCKATIEGYSDWYLPALCEEGFDGPGCGSAPSPTLQNMQSNLVDTSIVALSGVYWSSTEFSPAPDSAAWSHGFFGSGGSFHTALDKVGAAGVRCARAVVQ